MAGVFAILGAFTIAGAIAAMTLRSLIHSVLALVITFAGLASLYLLLGAQFVGFAQILVYVGAVAILAIFAVLLTRGADPALDAPNRSSWIIGSTIATAVFGVLAWAIRASSVSAFQPALQTQITVSQIGVALMGPFVVSLEVLGLLLTAALVGAVVIARRERKVLR